MAEPIELHVWDVDSRQPKEPCIRWGAHAATGWGTSGVSGELKSIVKRMILVFL